MDVNSILRRSLKGEAEIKTREQVGEPTLRLLLILADGKKSVRELHQNLLKMPNYAGTAQLQKDLNKLLRNGYLEDASVRIKLSAGENGANNWGATDARLIKQELIAIANHLLGAQGKKVVKKIEAASDTKESIVAAIDDCTKLVRLFIDEDKADQLALKSRTVIASRD